tara:strand:+ start:578 stop:4804 length:4227 start_codon:yes stop_codon:yes gene_type:complete
MKYFSLALIFLTLLPFFAIGQTSPSQDQNYVRQINYSTALSQYDVEHLPNTAINNDKKIEAIVYYDGLGRPKQRVAVRAGGDREDLVTPIQYDALGRQPKDWLPYPAPNNYGTFIPVVTTPLQGYYYYEFPESLHPYNNNPYSERRFENSPLNRVLEQGAPGKDWRINPDLDTDHTIKFGYEFNSGSEVWNFYVNYENGFHDPQLRLDGTYSVNTLSRNVTKDENWQPSDGATGTVVEFTNKQGQVLLKRQVAKDANNQSYNLDTYYVYDDFGNLTYVLSPEGSAQIVINNQLIPQPQIVLDKLCYQYHYDHRNRLIWKKIPGKEEERIRYDSLDRPVLTQDGNLASTNQWLFTKYDALNRVVYTGIYSPPLGLDVEQEFLQHTTSAVSENRTLNPTTIGGKDFFYTNTAYPTASSYMEILTINYYDDYVDYTVTNGPILAPPTSVMGVPTTENINSVTTTQGLPTVTWAKVLGSGNPGLWITTVMAYDGRGRATYTDSYNEFLQTRDVSRNLLEAVSGRVSETLTTHTKTGQSNINIRDYFTYDHMGRLLSQKQKIGNSPLQLIAENQYDELGQLVRKNVGGETALEGYTDMEKIYATSDGTLYHTVGDGYWPSRAKTRGRVESGSNGGIVCTVPEDDKHMRMGLIKAINSGQENAYFDYGIYTEYDSGTQTNKVKLVLGNSSSTGDYGTYTAGTIFKVERVGNLIRFFRNGVPFHSVNADSGALVGKVAFSGPGGSVEGLALTGPNIDKKLQKVRYAYNIRGWLTDINDIDPGPSESLLPLFNFRINYNTLEGNATGTPLYNGNIAQTLWKTMNLDKEVRGYTYSYDDLNRITAAESYKGTALGTMALNTEYTVSGISFDRNGNILSLTRRGANENTTPSFGVWDDLTYTYNGNRLMKVADNPQPTSHKAYGFKDGINSGDDYLYDDNGNMVKDNNKGIESITYNHLNLPSIIRFDPGSSLTNSISYIYDAMGNKLAKILNDNNVVIATNYDGGYVYSDMGSPGNIKLQFFSQPEGYVEPVAGTLGSVKGFDTGTGTGTQSTYRYVFQYKDHLGNVRLSYSDANLDGAIQTTGPNSEIVEESNYYPFGLQQKGYNNNVSPSGNALAQKFKYQGQELEEELGKNTYAYEQRDYDPALGRFNKIDRYAAKYLSNSPYQFSLNNPIYFREVNGDTIKLKYGKRSLTYHDGNLYENGALVERNKNGKITGAGRSFFNSIEGKLSKIGSKERGDGLIGLLDNSENVINIEYQEGASASLPSTAGFGKPFNLINSASYYERKFYGEAQSSDAIGSGSTIYFDHNVNREINSTTGRITNEDNIFVLAHELFHSAESNYGMLSNKATAKGLIREYRAVDFTNSLRNDFNLGYKRINSNSGVSNDSYYSGGSPLIETPGYINNLDNDINNILLKQ